MKPKVSIIVPCYNTEKFLVECMDSILGQSLHELEIICVNDGSTDNSLSILNKYAVKDSRIRIISKVNAGYGAAINDGIAAASGDYIGIVEPDDYIHPDMYRELYNTAKEVDAEVAKADFYSFCDGPDGRKLTYRQIAPGKCFYGKLMDSTKSNALFFLVMMSWEGIYKRSFLLEHSILHNTTPGASFQDNGFWFQVFTFAKRVYLINKAFYHYRVDNASSSINTSTATFRIFEEYYFIRDFLEKEPARWNRLRHIYSYFYFINLIARLTHTDSSRRAEFAQMIREEYIKYKAAGDIDLKLLPEFLVKQLEEIQLDPEVFNPLEHDSIEAISWDEVERRHSATDIFVNSVSPYSVVKDYIKSVYD